MVGEKRRGEKNSKLALHYSDLCHLENIAVTKFSNITFKLNKTRHPDKELIHELRETCKEFRTYLKHDSAQIWTYAYMLFNVLAYIEKKYSLVIKQSHEVIKYMEDKGIERSAHFYKDMTPALIREGRYEEAVVSIEKAIQRINKGSMSWSVFVYYRLIIELHRGDYQKAYDIFLKAENKRHINKAMADTWRIVKGYMKFLIESDKVDGSSHFKLGRFLNDIEVFSSDKSGQNINLIILKVILRLGTDRGRSHIIDERENVQWYANFYLEKGSRSRIFFQMLHQIVAGDFQRGNVSSLAQPYMDMMPSQNGYDGDLEMVPFEDLWALVLEGLD